MSPADPQARARAGEEARRRVPPEVHAELTMTDPPMAVRVLTDQAVTRVPELIAIRHTRMSASPFAFFRGSAAIMARQLADTPVSGLDVQLCGDAHLANFGMFASPERALLFDVNDFDETYPGPWEWDLKRFTASLVVAARENGLTRKQARRIVLAAVRRYRDAMVSLAQLGNLAVWYTRVDVEEAQRVLGDQLDQRGRKRLTKSIAKARGRDHLRALDQLTAVVDGGRRIVADPPLVVPISELAADLSRDGLESAMADLLRDYAGSLPAGYRQLMESYSFVDMARKVVGVGSVGTRCWIVLMRGRDDDDPLFLQVKEAQESVLAPHLGPRTYDSEGERVVTGQRIMQAASDGFLGWLRSPGLDGSTRDFYVRQLHDWKGSAVIERMSAETMSLYAELCSWTLARAHARSGDRIAIAAYLGDDDRLPQALADFAEAAADLNDREFAAFSAAVTSGELVGTVGGAA